MGVVKGYGGLEVGEGGELGVGLGLGVHIPVRGKLSGTRFWLRHPFFLPIFHHGTRFGTRFFSLGTRILFSKSP